MTEAELEQAEACLSNRYSEAGELREAGQAVAVEVRRLRQELKDWAEHGAGCDKRYTESQLRGVGWSPERIACRECTCGLDWALAGEG